MRVSFCCADQCPCWRPWPLVVCNRKPTRCFQQPVGTNTSHTQSRFCYRLAGVRVDVQSLLLALTVENTAFSTARGRDRQAVGWNSRPTTSPLWDFTSPSYPSTFASHRPSEIMSPWWSYCWLLPAENSSLLLPFPLTLVDAKYSMFDTLGYAQQPVVSCGGTLSPSPLAVESALRSEFQPGPVLPTNRPSLLPLPLALRCEQPPVVCRPSPFFAIAFGG